MNSGDRKRTASGEPEYSVAEPRQLEVPITLHVTGPVGYEQPPLKGTTMTEAEDQLSAEPPSGRQKTVIRILIIIAKIIGGSHLSPEVREDMKNLHNHVVVWR